MSETKILHKWINSQIPHISTSSITTLDTMKGKIAIQVVFTLIASVKSVFAFDISVFGEKAVINLNLTPPCAQMCILNPKWAKTYAPECSEIPLGIEYGTKLCQNYMYQHMLDTCFKDKCSPKDRKKARMLGKDTCEGYGVEFDLPPW